jgi:F-type H+-transporting ATPase subunit delta
MQTHPVARVYAEALLELAQKQGRTDEFGAQLSQLLGLLQATPGVRVFLESPSVGIEDKKRVLETALRGRIDDLLVNFVGLLIDKGRLPELPGIAAAYRDQADEAMGRSRVRAQTAVPLPADLRQRLEAILRQKLQRECVLEVEVQPQLLGGLVLTIGDKVYDGSVSGQLRRLRQAMMRSSGV